jgi:hypothetical protein
MGSSVLELRTGERGCIQTAAKRAHAALVGRIMSSDDEPSREDAEHIELLAELLNTVDFSALRASSEALAGVVEALVVVKRGASGEVELEVVDEAR